MKRGENFSQWRKLIDTSTCYTRWLSYGTWRPYGLPDPRGSLLASIELSPKWTSGGPEESRDQRGLYVKLSSSQRCEIAKYADQHGATETAQHFSRKLGKYVSESTVKSIEKAFNT